jgi:N-acetylmuramoyl-L-alanine amidase
MHRSKQLYSITSSARESSIGEMVRARRSLHIARNSAGVSIIGTAMKTKFHRARDKPGLFAARRFSLHHCHRMLTASIVAWSSLIVPLAVFEPAWPEEIVQARREPEPSKCNCSQFRVILDAGHTAEAPGAVSARNVPECRNSYRASLIYTHSYLPLRGHRYERPVLALGPHKGAALGDEL